MALIKTAVLLLAALFVASLFGCTKKEAEKGGAPVAGKTEVIKIGFLGALTGDVAMVGAPTLQGITMAVDEINASGGVLGKRVEIVEADNRGDKQEGAAIAQKFIARDEVVAIIGDPTTGITKVVAPIAQKAKVVLLSAGSTGPGVVENGDFIFRDTLLDSVAIPACMDYFANTLKFRKVALITSDNNDYSVGLSQTFRDTVKKVKEIEIVADEKIKDGDKDFSGQITNIKVKTPDVIFFSGYYTEGALIMKEARKQGMTSVMFDGDGLFSPKFIELGGPAVEGSMVALGFSPEQGFAETSRFVAGFKKKYNEVPGLFAAQGYDAVLLIADAMRRAKSSDPRQFKNELARTRNFQGASGSITIRANREPIKSPLSLLVVKGGRFTLKATVPVKAQVD